MTVSLVGSSIERAAPASTCWADSADEETSGANASLRRAEVTFPINTVRHQKLESGRGFWGGYFLSGGTIMGSVTRRFPLAEGFFLSLDSRASVSYVHVPVYNGSANVPNFALHFHAGLGFQPERGAEPTTP